MNKWGPSMLKRRRLTDWPSRLQNRPAQDYWCPRIGRPSEARRVCVSSPEGASRLCISSRPASLLPRLQPTTGGEDDRSYSLPQVKTDGFVLTLALVIQTWRPIWCQPHSVSSSPVRHLLGTLILFLKLFDRHLVEIKKKEQGKYKEVFCL